MRYVASRFPLQFPFLLPLPEMKSETVMQMQWQRHENAT